MSKFKTANYVGERGVEYARYIGQDRLNHLGHRLNARLFLPYLSPSMSVLDFGCGNGSLAAELAPHVTRIEGLEVNEYPRTVAKTKQGLIVYGDLSELIGTAPYDAVVSNHVLEHVPNVIETLSLLKSHLKKGGIFVCVVPIDDYRSGEHKKWVSGDRDRHLHTWTPLTIGNTFEEAGFRPLEIKILTSAWSEKLFFLGDGILQRAACWALAVWLKRRQIRVVAQRI